MSPLTAVEIEIFGRRVLAAARTVTFEMGNNKLTVPGGISASDAGNAFGLPVNTVKRGRSILRKGSPTLIQAVEDGRISFYLADRIVRRVPMADQPSAIAAVAGKVGPNTSMGILLGDKPRERRQPDKPLEIRMARVLAALIDDADLLEKFSKEIEPKSWQPKWIEGMTYVNRKVSRILKEILKEGN